MQNNAKGTLYRYVDELRNYLGISQSELPVNVIDLCHKEGSVDIMYHQFDTAGFCGAALVGNIKDTIILNSTRSESEQNFDCGHEVVHLTKHRTQNSGVFNCFKNAQNSFFEWEANEGSAELIIPSRIFIPDVASAYPMLNSFDSIFSFKHDMVQKYNVTIAMIEFRLESLKYEIYQRMNGTELDDIVYLSRREQLQKGIHVSSVIDLENSILESCFGLCGI